MADPKDIGLPFPTVILVKDPTLTPPEFTVSPQCVGDHFFEEVCQKCGVSKPGGPCEVCPHIGPASTCSAEHFVRRPCLKCGSADLRSVRVRFSM